MNSIGKSKVKHKVNRLKRHKPNAQARRARKMAKHKMLKGLTAPLQGGRRGR